MASNLVLSEEKTNGSVVDTTFREIDEKFFVLDVWAKDWIKMKIMIHITEAYNRGKLDAKK